MEQKHRAAIQSNFTSLVERTHLDLIVTALYEKGVFSEQMIEPYQNNNERERDRKRKLYMDITRRGPQAFGHLVDALLELGYWDLVRELDPDNPFSYSGPRSFHPIPRSEPRSEDDDNFRSLSTLNRPKPKPQPKATSPPPPPPPPQPQPQPQPAAENDNATDEDAEVPQFVVKKSTQFMEDDDKRDLKLYRTRGRNRGVLLDFTYMKFDNDVEEFRNGVDVDCKNLKYLFSELGFRVIRYLNLTKAETEDTLKSLDKVLVNTECVFVVVSSHGYECPNSSDTEVRCKDGKLIKLYAILKYFNNNNMPGLFGVPKVFIVQTCRGGDRDYAWQSQSAHRPPHMPMPRGEALYDGAPSYPHAGARAGPPASPLPTEIPLYSDILIANSTLPGLVARRDRKLGSWFVQVVCEVFAERAHDCHVEKLFTLVDQRMRDKFKVQTSSVERWGFNKRLYLHPGLYES